MEGGDRDDGKAESPTGSRWSAGSFFDNRRTHPPERGDPERRRRRTGDEGGDEGLVIAVRSRGAAADEGNVFTAPVVNPSSSVEYPTVLQS